MSTLSDHGGGSVPDLAQEMIDRIEAVEQVDDRVDGDGITVDADGNVPAHGRLAPWDLPGFGGLQQDDCGHEEPHFCDECGKVHGRGRTCSQSRCERCWTSWVIDKAERHTARADAVARYLGSSGTAHHKHHVAFMLPPDWRPVGDEQERYEATKNVVKDIISDVWGDNAMFVYHGWSGSGYGEDEGVGDDRGEWADRLDPEHRDWFGDVKDELYARPHFHAIIVADEIPGGDITKSVYEKTGWLINRIYDEETNRSIGGETRHEEMKALARATTYTLSHTSVDCTGENNDAKVHTCGSEWWDYDNITTLDDTEREAKRAVRAVAPTTLDVDEEDVACVDKVAPERAVDSDADDYHTDDHDCGCEGVCTCGPAAPDDAAAGEQVRTTGTVVGVDDAAGTVTLQVGTEQWEVSAGDVGQLGVGDKKTVTGTLDDDGTIDGELEDPRVDCQGAMRHIEAADEVIDDDDWRERAQWADETVDAWEWWIGADGAPPEPPPL
jgi:hypothetical protein